MEELNLMDRIAITGVNYAGKSRLAKALVDLGYLYIPFGDHLKTIAAEALSHLAKSTDLTALPNKRIKMEHIIKDKEHYRTLLIGLGAVIGYNDNPFYMKDILLSWHAHGRPRAIFDSVRSSFQADYLREQGFHIVELVVPLEVRQQRAAAHGVKLTKEKADSDIRLPDEYVRDLILDGTANTDAIAKQLVRHID